MRKKLFFGTLASVVLGFVTNAFADEVAKPQCYDFADPVRVKVGNAEFKIPADFHPELYIKVGENYLQENCRCYDRRNEDGNIVARGGYCQESTAPAFETNSIFIRNLNSFFPVPETNIKPTTPSFIDMVIRGGELTFPSNHFFCYYKNRFYLKSKDWKKSKTAKNFFEIEYVMDSSDRPVYRYYYSDKHTIFGIPILVECEGKEEFTFRGNKPRGHYCKFQTAIDSRREIVVRFYDGIVTQDKWSEFFEKIEKFLRNVSVDKIPDMKFRSCN